MIFFFIHGTVEQTNPRTTRTHPSRGGNDTREALVRRDLLLSCHTIYTEYATDFPAKKKNMPPFIPRISARSNNSGAKNVKLEGTFVVCLGRVTGPFVGVLTTVSTHVSSVLVISSSKFPQPTNELHREESRGNAIHT
jgi:hypothetical protein